MRAVERVPQSAAHAAILSAMISFYLSAPGTLYHGASATKGEILARLGLLGPLTMAMLKARRGATRLVAKAS